MANEVAYQSIPSELVRWNIFSIMTSETEKSVVLKKTQVTQTNVMVRNQAKKLYKYEPK